LSYAIARAYCQFYDSALMRRRWSSDNIWFMPAAENGDHRLPLRAFVGFPFDDPDETPEDFIQDLRIPLHHRCPRIFALGILLLEIGLGRPFPTRVFKKLTSQVNFDYTTASKLLETFRKETWNGFSHKKYFIDAVEYCIDGGNFMHDLTEQRGNAGRSNASGEPQDRSKRRKNLYSRVVQPLAWLSIKGFNSNSTEVPYLSRIPEPDTIQSPTPGPVDASEEEGGGFHSGLAVSTSNWLRNLKAISSYVDQKRNAIDGVKPIKVAILDTGINTSMPFFQDEDYGSDRRGQIELFKDFVDTDVGSTVDEFGHGSLMSRLVAETTAFESTPFAKIMVARVAKNTKLLLKSQDKVAEVRSPLISTSSPNSLICIV
jgi:hypothetical protein